MGLKLMSRKIDDKTYLGLLLQSLNVDDLKQICRDFEIKGFSSLTKGKIVEFIIDSLSEEEHKDVINQKELEIVSSGIDLALKKINGEDREKITNFKIVNPNEHEIEIYFKGFNWEVTSFLSINDQTINNPERDCDCKIGASMGFCSHFWVGFIFSLKQEYFKISDWTLTVLPENFKEKIKSIKIRSDFKEQEEGKESKIQLIDESSENFALMESVGKTITVYESEITSSEEKEQDFQGNITKYYIISLKSVKFGPKIERKSDFREEDIKNVDKLNLRISDKLFSDNNLKIGDKISGNGKLERDNFLGPIVKNIKKISKI